MTIEEIVKKSPGIEKLGFSNFESVISKKFNLKFDPNKTWKEIGLDELDTVEMIMELEKQFDFIFYDELFDEVFGENQKPIDFRAYKRNELIDKIINDK